MREAPGGAHEARQRRLRRPASAVCVLAAAALTACGTAPSRYPGTETPRKPGGYYLDDGPHANPPANLDQVPDAQPKLEPIRSANTRPYNALGKTYVPMTELGAYRATGLASWYGKRYHGKATASGEVYDMYAMTAAHPTLPIPSYARVTCLATERTVVVRINDRGPFHSDRLIDLSYVAAYKLGLLANGSAVVVVESILPDSAAATVAATQRPSPVAPARDTPASTSAPIDRPGLYLQLGAFSMRENAASLLARLQAELGWLADLTGIYQTGDVYRVQAGPYANREEALQAAARIEQALDLKPVVISR
jgi:rare lipoprotein A